MEELIGKYTVDTMPLQTLEAFRDHGRVQEALTQNPAESAKVLERLAEAGIDMGKITSQLEEDGIRLFGESYNDILESIKKKREMVKVGA